MTTNKPRFEVRLLDYNEHKRTKRPSVNAGTTNETPLLTCIDCNEVKPRSKFYNASSRPNGKQTYCRACQIKRLGQDPAVVSHRGPDMAFRDDPSHVVEVESDPDNAIGLVKLAEKVHTEYRKRHNINNGIGLCKWEIVHAVLNEWIGGDA